MYPLSSGVAEPSSLYLHKEISNVNDPVGIGT
jgi:hypothetical protein